jgi:hypothetical protein
LIGQLNHGDHRVELCDQPFSGKTAGFHRGILRAEAGASSIPELKSIGFAGQ